MSDAPGSTGATDPHQHRPADSQQPGTADTQTPRPATAEPAGPPAAGPAGPPPAVGSPTVAPAPAPAAVPVSGSAPAAPAPATAPTYAYPGYAAPGAPAPKKSAGAAIGLSVAALVVGLLGIGVVLSILAWSTTAQGETILQAVGLSLIVGGLAALLTLALAITALVVAIRRRHAASIAMAALAAVASVSIAAIAAATIYTGGVRLDGEFGSDPSASGTPGSDIDPVSIAWDNGDLAGSTPPRLTWDEELAPTWNMVSDSGSAILAEEGATSCEARIAVSDLPASTTSADDESRSLELLAEGASPAADAELWDIDIYWSADSEATGLTFVMVETETADATTMSAYRAINSSASSVSYVITCPLGGDEGASALDDAHDAVWNALTLNGE